jgi:hypothetical protein
LEESRWHLTEEKQKSIDDQMLLVHKAVRCTVTNKEWKQMSDSVWICAYIKWPKSVKVKPTLYMVHYLNDRGREAVVVYRSIESEVVA